MVTDLQFWATSKPYGISQPPFLNQKNSLKAKITVIHLYLNVSDGNLASGISSHCATLDTHHLEDSFELFAEFRAH